VHRHGASAQAAPSGHGRSGAPLRPWEPGHQHSLSYGACALWADAKPQRCWKLLDNARMESFFATLKKEKIYRMATYKLPREQVRTIIFRYVFVYYNRIRIYSRNPLELPPVRYREWAAAHR